MADDYPIEDFTISDQARPRRDNTLERTRVYTFFLGKHGPFTERVPLENFDEREIDRRIAALRSHLQQFGK